MDNPFVTVESEGTTILIRRSEVVHIQGFPTPGQTEGEYMVAIRLRGVEKPLVLNFTKSEYAKKLMSVLQEP